MKPRIPLHNPAFRYRSSVDTNVAETFARERRRLAAIAKEKAREEAAAKATTVRPIKRSAA